MSERPWWASMEGAEPQLDDQDPLLAHRTGRRGQPDEPQAVPSAPQPPPAPDPPGDHADGPDSDEQHHADICGVCPICVGMRALEETRPELVAHLTAAARHLTAAMRSALESAEGAASKDDALERIDLDD